MHFSTIHTANVAQKGNLTEHTQMSSTSEIEHQSHSANLLPPRVYSMLYHAGMLTDHANTPISKYNNHCILDNTTNKSNNNYVNKTNKIQNVNNILGNEEHSTTLTTTDMLHDAHHTTENKFVPQTQTAVMTPCVSIREFSREQFATATQTPSTHSTSMCKYMNSMQQQHHHQQQQHQVQTNEQQAVSYPITWNKWSSERNSEHCSSKMTHSAKVNRTLNTSVTIGEDYGISPESHSVSTDVRVMQTPSFKPGSTHDSIRLAYTQLQPSRSRIRASLSPPTHTHRNLFSTLSHDIVCTADKSAIAVPVSTELTQNKLIYTHACEPPFALAKATDINNSTIILNNNNNDNDHDDVHDQNNNEINEIAIIREQLTKLDKEEILEILSDVLTYSNDDEKLYNIICNKVNSFIQSNDTESKEENCKNTNNVCTRGIGNHHGSNEVNANNGYDQCNEKVESPVQKESEWKEESNNLEQLHTPPMLAETVTLPSNVFNEQKEDNACSMNVHEAIQARDENDANLLALQTFSSTPHESTSCKDDGHKESSNIANTSNSVESYKKMSLCDVNALGSLQEQQQQQQKQEHKSKVSPENREFAQEMHPCLQEYGNCRYPRTCPYALVPRNFCLNWLYNECSDGESCLRVHRLPRECPEVVQKLYDHYQCIESDNEQAYQMHDEHQTNSAITSYDKYELVERITPKQKDMNATTLTSKCTSLQRNANQGNTPMITFTNTPWQRNETRHICHVQPIAHSVQANAACNDHLANTTSPFRVPANTQNNGEAELNRRVYRSLNDSFDRACQMR